jgi:hypothetical protein
MNASTASGSASSSRGTAGTKGGASKSADAKSAASRPAAKTSGKASPGASTSGRRGSESADSSAARTTPYRITQEEALDNTRTLLAAKQARARKTPAWQAHDTQSPGNVPDPGFESNSARDRADELHQGEMRLNANEGAISNQDRRNQGKRDSR